jgi:hypothetical protein
VKEMGWKVGVARVREAPEMVVVNAMVDREGWVVREVMGEQEGGGHQGAREARVASCGRVEGLGSQVAHSWSAPACRAAT